MKFVAITTRVIKKTVNNEDHFSLDVRWFKFLEKCNLVPLILPCYLDSVRNIINNVNIKGVILSGGGNISELGGSEYERDKIEEFLINLSMDEDIPLLGVCRGMEKIQAKFGINLTKVSGHIKDIQEIPIDYKIIADIQAKKYHSHSFRTANSYHEYGSYEDNNNFYCFAKTSDNVIKAMRHKKHKILGIMWHPERLQPFNDADIDLFSRFFHK